MGKRNGERWPDNIRPRGNGLQIRIKYKGKEYTKQIDCDPLSPRDIKSAIQERDKIKSSLNLGINPFFEETKGLENPFSKDAQSYLDQLDVDDSTHLSYEQLINQYWMTFANWPTSMISTLEIKKRLAAMDVSVKTKKNALIPLKGIFDFANINPNPARLKMPRHQKQKVSRFLPQERELILSHLDGQYRVYFALLFGCGLRPSGEPLALKWCDYSGDTLHIYKTIVRRKIKNSTKTHTERTVIVPHWVQDILNNHDTRFAGEWIFADNEGNPHLSADGFNKKWRKVFDKTSVKRAGIRYRIPYVCRHTRAAEMLSIGIEPARAARQLGHTVEIFLRTYSEFIEEYSETNDREKLLKGAFSKRTLPNFSNRITLS